MSTPHKIPVDKAFAALRIWVKELDYAPVIDLMAAGHDSPLNAGLLPENRWRGFPTVSPVHRGNDGLPFSLDNLTISFTKWRTESLKAYGNAIVPQVMYRIFQAIETI